MCFRITDSPSIDGEKHTYGDGSAVTTNEGTLCHVICAGSVCVFASRKSFCIVV